MNTIIATDLFYIGLNIFSGALCMGNFRLSETTGWRAVWAGGMAINLVCLVLSTIAFLSALRLAGSPV